VNFRITCVSYELSVISITCLFGQCFDFDEGSVEDPPSSTRKWSYKVYTSGSINHCLKLRNYRLTDSWNPPKSRDNSVGIATRLWAVRWGF
jgi:hypothetical protein